MCKIILKAKSVPISNVENDGASSNILKHYSVNETALDVVNCIKDLAQKKVNQIQQVFMGKNLTTRDTNNDLLELPSHCA